jgi:acetyl-CoA C-acetyltransferase
MLAAQSIRAGDSEVVVAGGFESMSLAPHLEYLRTGVVYGDAKMLDHLAHDGLTCPFEGWAMGSAAEYIARKNGISRAEQDRFAAQSHARAAEATARCHFKAEITALSAEVIQQKEGLDRDEGFRTDTSVDKLAKLAPAFDREGSVTAGNASQLSDGAAALVVASGEAAADLGAEPMARVVDYGTVGVAPRDIFDAPGFGIAALLDRNGLTVGDIDLFELNEAFAAQVLANIRRAGIPEDRLNICGGAIALGHPIGASGARVLTTLLHQMARTGARRGVASLCLGGGNAVSMLVERG